MNNRIVPTRILQYLIAVAEHGNFTQAAKALYVSQPTLSQQIKKLEDLLDSPLLDRSGHTVQLTDAGKVYLYHIQRAWKEFELGMRAVDDIKGLKSGVLRLGWTPLTNYLTCYLLGSFNNHYPSVRLQALEMPQNKIENAITGGHIDIGIVFGDIFTDGRSEEFENYTLSKESFCVAVGQTHILNNRNKEVIGLSDFEKQPLALLSEDFLLRQYINRYCQKQHIRPFITLEANSLNMIVKIVQSGILATILPNTIANQCELQAIKILPKLPHKAVNLVYRKMGHKSHACLAFIQVAKNWSNFKDVLKPSGQSVQTA